MLYLAQLLGSNFLEVAEVKPQGVGSNQRSFLLHVCAQDLAQSLVKQVSAGVVGFNGTTLVHIDAGHEFCFRSRRNLVQDVDGYAILLFGVKHLDGLVLVDKYSLVANLASHLSIERSLIQNSFVDNTLLLLHLAILQDVAGIFRIVVSYELAFSIVEDNPVASFHLSCVSCACLLLLHLHVEPLLVYRQSILAADQFSQVQRESEGVEERESLVASNLSLAGCTCLLHHSVEQFDTVL